MARDQAQIVEDSFATIGPVTLEMGEAFYENLFETAPDLRGMFAQATVQQAMRFSEVLAYIVSNLRAPERLLPIVRALGARHREIGVVAEQYAPFRAAFLKTLQQRMQQGWTPEVATAWASTFDMVAEEMLKA
ncbi:MAG TPA: globin domain-containing protein [Rhodoblastus sp.]|nr:globin domain-containing protein [Rhodoblastus sp.]